MREIRENLERVKKRIEIDKKLYLSKARQHAYYRKRGKSPAIKGPKNTFDSKPSPKKVDWEEYTANEFSQFFTKFFKEELFDALASVVDSDETKLKILSRTGLGF